MIIKDINEIAAHLHGQKIKGVRRPSTAEFEILLENGSIIRFEAAAEYGNDWWLESSIETFDDWK